MAKRRKAVSKSGRVSGMGAARLARKGTGQVRNPQRKAKARKR